MDKEFDENAPEFNLEAIYAMQMHLFAEDINEISNAATMELQIEKGLEAIALIWKTMAIEVIAHKDKGVYRYSFILILLSSCLLLKLTVLCTETGIYVVSMLTYL